MNVYKVAGGMLVLGVIVGISIGQSRVTDSAYEIAAEVHPFDEDAVLQHPAIQSARSLPSYLVATVGPDSVATLSNPREAEGTVFYITDIISEGFVGFRSIPELSDGVTSQILEIAPITLDGAMTKQPINLNTPLPLVSSITVRNRGEGAADIIFAGYFSNRQPRIETMIGSMN
jgi:hypothetical protein